MAHELPLDVVYCRPDKVFHVELVLSEGASVRDALVHSGLLFDCPELTLDTVVVGIFSKRATLATTLAAGDRVEIYRPLRVDPRTARRLRQAKKQI